MDAKTIISMQSPAYEPADDGAYWPSTTPGAVIGITRSGRPIRLAAGGAEDDDEGTEDEDTGDGDEDGDEDEGGEEENDGAGGEEKSKKKETDDKADVVSRSELRRAVAERQKAKKELREARQELDELKRTNEGAEERVAREAREKAMTEAEAKYKPKAVRGALLEAGVLPKKVAGALKLLNLAEIEVDDELEVTGLDDQLDALRDDWPELFPSAETEAKTERRGSRAADGADKKPERKKPPTTTERQAAALLGKPIR